MEPSVEERRRSRVIGFLVSLAVHLSAAAIALWPVAQVGQVPAAGARDPVVFFADSLPDPAPASIDRLNQFGYRRLDQYEGLGSGR